MRVLLISQYFYPEEFKCNDIAFELSRRGHDVTVLTGIPNYPKGKYFPGYGVLRKRREVIDGVKVVRALTVPRKSGSGKWLAMNYLSYAFFATVNAVGMAFRGNYDAIFVHETSPVTVGIPAVIYKKIKKIPLYFWVLDLWPESLEAAGGIKNKRILNAFGGLTKWIYRNSSRILISSRSFATAISRMGDFSGKVEYFPNWGEREILRPSGELPVGMPEGFNVVFTGNIGEAQDMPHILEAARLLKDSNVNIILIGEGRKRAWLEKQIAAMGLTNLYCPGRFPRETMPGFYEAADVLFFSLKKEPVFALTCPAKVQAYMSSGKPIVAMIDGDAARVIEDAGCGWSVPAEDARGLADLLLRLSNTDKKIFEQKGKAGLEYYRKHFDYRTCIDNLERMLTE